MIGGTLFKIDGMDFPSPNRAVSREGERLVDGVRNNKGVVISQPVGRELEKFSSLEWAGISLATWENILGHVQQFYSDVTYYSPYERGIVTRKFYWGNVSELVWSWQPAGMGLLKPKIYQSCKVNIIDVGE